MLCQYFLRLLQGGALRRRNKVIFRHNIFYQAAEIPFKTKVAVGQYTDKLALHSDRDT